MNTLIHNGKKNTIGKIGLLKDEALDIILWFLISQGAEVVSVNKSIEMMASAQD